MGWRGEKYIVREHERSTLARLPRRINECESLYPTSPAVINLSGHRHGDKHFHGNLSSVAHNLDRTTGGVLMVLSGRITSKGKLETAV